MRFTEWIVCPAAVLRLFVYMFQACGISCLQTRLCIYVFWVMSTYGCVSFDLYAHFTHVLLHPNVFFLFFKGTKNIVVWGTKTVFYAVIREPVFSVLSFYRFEIVVNSRTRRIRYLLKLWSPVFFYRNPVFSTTVRLLEKGQNPIF